MDSSRRHYGLVAVSLYDGGRLSFARWSSALIAALSGLASWRILVAAQVGALPSGDVSEAVHQAIAAGGDLEIVPIPASNTLAELTQDLPEDTLVLSVASATLLLRSTVERLVRACETLGAPVAARTLPFDGGVGIPRTPTDACVLASVGQIRTTVGALSGATRDEAVVVRDLIVDVTCEEKVVVGELSLLEEAIRHGVASSAAESLVADALGGSDEPLLSVVMRTQVHRPEALRDVLLCLAAQTDGRFELLLVSHNADPGLANEILLEQPLWLRERTRLLVATGGTRSRPLNIGFEAARGTHVAILDDDDIVTSRWVERFLMAAASHPRRLLRSVVGVQRVTAIEWANGIAGHTATPVLDVPYPRTFDLADHMRVNMTPFMALAFPRATLNLLGGADENLEVCEDWDLLLRAAVVVGVVDVPYLTAVYRRWTSGDDSYSSHDTDAWERDMAIVRAKLDAAPVLLPPGSASALAALSQLRADPSALAEVYNSTSWRVTAPLRAASRLMQRMRRTGPERADI